ncbi:helix-turn-helix transcriptional regulator [Thalassotalea fusca]
MRASRLLTILMKLQSKGRVTAGELAQDCQVSVRSIYRDIETLSSLGIPVYSEQGSNGGYQLLDGYRTQLNGLSKSEAESLFLLGLSDPAEKLGLAPAMSEARLKLLAALPKHLRDDAERFHSCFLLDSPAWFNENEEVDYLPQLMSAAWNQQRVEIEYQSWRACRMRTIEPYGLVLKSGVWYLVANSDHEIKTFKVSRIKQLSVLNQVFEQSTSFDLSNYWKNSTAALEKSLYPNNIQLKLTSKGLKLLHYFSSPYVRQHTSVISSDEKGWTHVSLPAGKHDHTIVDILRLGPDAVVAAPEDLRVAVRKVLADMAEQYK